MNQESSGTTAIFSNSLSAFSPAQPSSPFDTSYAGSVAVGSPPIPNWCGLKTDEIQKITITGCNHTLSSPLKTITMAIVDVNYYVRSFSFLCDASASSFRSAYMTANTGKSVFVSLSQSTSTGGSTNPTFTIGYQASIGGAKNWYQPYVISAATGLTVSVNTFQEGGYVNNQYVTLTVLQEIKSLYVSKSASFNATLTYGTTTKFNFTSINGVISNIDTMSTNFLQGLLSTITLISHTNWNEYQLKFNTVSKSVIIKDMRVQVTTHGLSLVASMNTLTTANSYPVFYDSVHKFGFLGSGQYTCYKREHNYTAWSYNTGYSYGVPSEVINTSINEAIIYDW